MCGQRADSTLEDKLVRDAVREVLEAVYEQDFLDCSYGLRPGRSAHDAVSRLDHIVHRGDVRWILEADEVSFFDSLDRTKQQEMLQCRVADGSPLRLVGKCLHVGVLDGAHDSTPETGVAQGSVLSPLLGNIYLHYVLDQWFETVLTIRLKGTADLIRYANDCAPKGRGKEAVKMETFARAPAPPVSAHTSTSTREAATPMWLAVPSMITCRVVSRWPTSPETCRSVVAHCRPAPGRSKRAESACRWLSSRGSRSESSRRAPRCRAAKGT